MAFQQLAQDLYKTSPARTGASRSVEYDAVARITRQLRNASRKGATGFSDLVQAVHMNRRLWTLFATNVADTDNALPDSLRAQLFYLAEFTQAHSEKILSGEASVRPLLEINMAVLRGLRGGTLA
ncbi:MAG: flagellar biosynthesis regulator FlaF [Pseudopelagicola sp.]|nr:flagellar biosynthesis regulator FlaF [Pseudopelagicola sp.]